MHFRSNFVPFLYMLAKTDVFYGSKRFGKGAAPCLSSSATDRPGYAERELERLTENRQQDGDG